jgi:ketosteroid isomerase-like protein
MSANLDLVRSIYADWERGDFSSTAWADPGIEYVVADGPAPGRWTGLAGMAEAWGGIASAWEELRVLAEEYVALDDERVLVLLDNGGRGKTSEIDLHQVRGGANLFHVRRGKVTRYVIYWDRDRAFADLGLAPGGERVESA